MNKHSEEFLNKYNEYKKKGYKLLSLDLIKDMEDFEGIKEAGVINTGILDEVEKHIHLGMTTKEIDKIVYDYTITHNAIPATLGFEGYPASCCTSVNEVVCHGIPSNRQLKNGDIVNVDVTTIYNNYVADASRMFVIGMGKPNALKLVNETKNALDKALNAIVPWKTTLGDIGHIIEEHSLKCGFQVVREITGHGVGYEMHEDPYVYHFGKPGKGYLIIPGMCFTIEPMINEGTRMVYQDARDGWTIYTYDHKLSAQWEYTIFITEEGPVVLTK